MEIDYGNTMPEDMVVIGGGRMAESMPPTQYMAENIKQEHGQNPHKNQQICDLCQVTCNSSADFAQHQAGKKHQKKLKRKQGLSQSGQNGVHQPAHARTEPRQLNQFTNGKMVKKVKVDHTRSNGMNQYQAPSLPQLTINSKQKANPRNRTTSTTLSQITKKKFSDLPISERTKQALAEVLHYEFMTRVQAWTLPITLKQVDVISKAKTGTGKTLSFLIPCVEQIARSNPGNEISCLIISPTRELAMQIEEECQQLVSFHSNITTQIVVGGTNIRTDLSRFRSRLPSILVATPGRLIDHFENNNLASATSNLLVLCFDEADRLLDMGFRPDIIKIIGFLPKQTACKRQTLLFSATMPEEISSITNFAFSKGNHEYIDCVGKEENTHEHVVQEYLISDLKDQACELFFILMEKMTEYPDSYKVIVFFTTARLTQFYAELFQASGISVLEIHSRKSQSHRTKVSTKFRVAKSGILFSSDVSARGLDYPDVTAVIQVGMPSDAKQYVHRIGRTARIGKGGSGVLMLCDFETYVLRDIKKHKIPLVKREPTHPEQIAQIHKENISVGLKKVRANSLTIVRAYQAWLGFYNSYLRKLGWSKEELVSNANYWVTEVVGVSEPPALQKRTIGKMGLRGVRGLRAAAFVPRVPRNGKRNVKGPKTPTFNSAGF